MLLRNRGDQTILIYYPNPDIIKLHSIGLYEIRGSLTNLFITKGLTLYMLLQNALSLYNIQGESEECLDIFLTIAFKPVVRF